MASKESRYPYQLDTGDAAVHHRRLEPKYAILAIALQMFFLISCELEGPKMPNDSNTHKRHLVFELASGTTIVGEDDLEKIRLAMLSFFQTSNPRFPQQYAESRDFFLAEIRSAACWIDENSAAIGVWRLENQKGHLFLVRYPEPELDMYIFHAQLEKKDSGWEVVSLEHEREFGPPSD